MHQPKQPNQIRSFTSKSPDILAPAKIPVAAGKNMENIEKNPSPSRKSGPIFSFKIEAKNVQNIINIIIIIIKLLLL